MKTNSQIPHLLTRLEHLYVVELVPSFSSDGGFCGFNENIYD